VPRVVDVLCLPQRARRIKEGHRCLDEPPPHPLSSVHAQALQPRLAFGPRILVLGRRVPPARVYSASLAAASKMEPGASPTSARMRFQLWRNALPGLRPVKRRYRLEGPENYFASLTKGLRWLASPGTAVPSASVSSPKRGTVISTASTKAA